MDSVELTLTHLKQAESSLKTATDLIFESSHPEWTRNEWEAVLEVVTGVDSAFECILHGFGRRYLSALTGKKIKSARGAILAYLRLNLGSPVSKERLRVIAGIGEWARRVRELRVQYGWPIRVSARVHSDYELTDVKPNPQAKKRWADLNRIRRMKCSPQERLLSLLKSRMGTPVDAEELEYVAKSPGWSEELTKLRSEFGLRISTATDRPELNNEYVLESDDPLPDDDEWAIPERIRGLVLAADGRRCTSCGWEQDTSDDRWLEVHRRSPGSELKDFVSMCSVCHHILHNEGPSKIRLKINRSGGVKSVDWFDFLRRTIPSDLKVEDAGLVIQTLLLTSLKIAGREMPHIREVNALRDNRLWFDRVDRVRAVLERRFGATWYTKVGLAVRPPFQGRVGDGFEQTMKYIMRQLTGLQAETHVSLQEVFPEGTFPDTKVIDLYVPQSIGTGALLSLKWSLRGDRTHQVQLEARTIKATSPDTFFALVTSEYDVTRLRPLIEDLGISAVYHVDKAGVEAMWGPELEGHDYVKELQSLTDLVSILAGQGTRR